MFERTLEAQALDAPDARLSRYSIALLLHVAVAAAAAVASLLVIRAPDVPEPPEGIRIFIGSPPEEFRLELPRREAAPAPRKGTNDPGRAVEPPRELPPVETPPTETPNELPPPVAEPAGDLGDGRGSEGVEDGVDRGVENGVGTGEGPGEGDGTGAGSGPVELTREMVAPVLLHKVSPSYPPAARIARVPGRVFVEAVIGLDGSVESVHTIGSTSVLFDDAALSAVRQWKYRPALMDGRPVRVYFKVEVVFVLR